MALESPTPDDVDPSTVVLRGQDELEYDTTPAAAAITPGMLIEQTANGVAPHGTAGETTAPRFAIENRQFGMFAGPGAADDFDDYAVGDAVWEAHFDEGHWVYALLAAGSAVNPNDDTVEDRVVSDGAGGFRPYDPVDTGANDDPSAIIGEAVRDPVDNAAGTGYARFKLRVY